MFTKTAVSTIETSLKQSATMSKLNLLEFFKVTSLSPQVALPSPDGPLSREVPSTAIAAANKESTRILVCFHSSV